MKLSLAILCVVAAVCAGGCYEHVVSAKGYGADQAVVQKANVPSGQEKTLGYKRIEHKQMP
jgi:hypothetical protein